MFIAIAIRASSVLTDLLMAHEMDVLAADRRPHIAIVLDKLPIQSQQRPMDPAYIHTLIDPACIHTLMDPAYIHTLMDPAYIHTLMDPAPIDLTIK